MADSTARRRPGRKLDGRTLGICLCLAVIGALAAALVANAVTGDGKAKGKDGDHLSLVSTRIDGAKLLAVGILTPTGSKTTLADQAGTKPLLVNMWQQSCTPCVKEMPLLDRLHRTDQRIDVIGLDVEDRHDLAEQMVRQTKITYPWLQDPDGNAFFQAKGVQLPRTVLVAPDGKVLGVKSGYFTSLADARSWVDAHIA